MKVINGNQLQLLAGTDQGNTTVRIRATANDGTWLEMMFILTIEAAELALNVDPNDQSYLYPNPARQLVSLSSEYSFLSVKNPSGVNQNVGFDHVSATLDVSALAPGVYFVTLMKAGKVERQKLIKQ